jgi:hypothetical protein
MIIHNSNPNLLVVFKAKLLKKIPGSGVKVGGTIYGSLMPNNDYYLSKSGTVGSRILGRVFKTDAVENVDFVRVP